MKVFLLWLCVLNGSVIVFHYLHIYQIINFEQNFNFFFVFSVIIATIYLYLFKPVFKTAELLGSEQYTISSFCGFTRLKYMFTMAGRFFISDTKLLFMSNKAIDFGTKNILIEKKSILKIDFKKRWNATNVTITHNEGINEFVFPRFIFRKTGSMVLADLQQLNSSLTKI